MSEEYRCRIWSEISRTQNSDHVWHRYLIIFKFIEAERYMNASVAFAAVGSGNAVSYVLCEDIIGNNAYVLLVGCWGTCQIQSESKYGVLKPETCNWKCCQPNSVYVLRPQSVELHKKCLITETRQQTNWLFGSYMATDFSIPSHVRQTMILVNRSQHKCLFKIFIFWRKF